MVQDYALANGGLLGSSALVASPTLVKDLTADRLSASEIAELTAGAGSSASIGRGIGLLSPTVGIAGGMAAVPNLRQSR